MPERSETAAQSKQTNNRKRNWPILLVMATAYMAVVMNMQGIKALLPHIEAEFMISGTEAGLYTAFYFASATLVAIYSGRIIDKIGPRKGLIIGAGSVGFLIVLQAASPLYGIILFLAFFAGFGFSIITPSASKGVMMHIPPENRAFSMGLTQSGAGAGGIVGALLLPSLAHFLGWRLALGISGGIAMIIALFIWKFYNRASATSLVNGGPKSGRPLADQPNRDGARRNGNVTENDADHENNEHQENYENPGTPKKREHTGESEGEPVNPQPQGSLKEDLKKLFKSRYLIWLCLMGAVFGMSISSVATHLPLFFAHDMGYGSLLAGIGLGVFQTGGLIGHPVWGWFSDSVLNGNRRIGLMLLGFLVAGLMLITGFIIVPFNLYVPVLGMGIAFLLGLTILGLPALYLAAISESVQDEFVGTATGIALTFIRIANVIFPPIFGFFADITGHYGLSWIFLGFVVLVISISFSWFTRNMASYQQIQ